MISLKEYASNLLLEHYLNAFKKEDMKKYADEVWKLLQKAYEYCGGMAGMDSVDQLIDETDIWKLVRKEGRIVAVMTYSTKRSGRKQCYGGAEKSDIGKQAFVSLLKEDFKRKEREAWAEMSGAMEVTSLKNGGMPIPAYIAQLIMKDKKFDKILDDGYHYVRMIGGEPHTKIMIGNFKNGDKWDAPKELLDELITTAKEIGAKEKEERENKQK